MKKVVSIILTPLFYSMFYLTLLVFHPLQVIAFYLFGYRAHKKTVDFLNLTLMLAPYFTGSYYKFVNFRKIPRKEPVIFVCNHQSMWDIPPLLWVLRNNHLKFVAKKELTRFIPSVSFNLRHGGSVNIDRSDKALAIRQITEFAQYIKQNNYSVCIYPEGTRTRDGFVKPFKTKGMKALLEVMPNALIVPIAIRGNYKFDRKNSFIKNAGTQLRYEMLPERYIELSKLEEEFVQMQKEIADIAEVGLR